MGAILRVWDEDLRRHLAMKVILGNAVPEETGATPTPSPQILSRFLEEAQITGQLDHPGVVPVHELGLDAKGRVFFTMKLVKGRDFEQVIADVHAGKDGWTLTRAVGVLLKVCEAIAYAHSKRVIHRDLKPSNLMVGRFGEVYVMDWGLARIIDREDTKDIRIRKEILDSLSLVETDRRREADSPLLTMDGDVVGTPAYMSPEQARGEVDRLGPASDVYSMGAVLYHLLSNRMPYVPAGARVSPLMVLRFVLEGEDPKPLREVDSGLPEELVAITEKAMSRDPDSRYPDVDALAEDLRRYLEGRPVGARPPRLGYVLRLAVKRHRAVVATAAIFLCLLLSAGVAFFVRIDQARRVATRERDAKDASLTRTRALALASAAAAARAEDPMRALLLAERAARLSREPDVIREVRASILASRERLVLRDHGAAVIFAAYTPDGKQLVTAAADAVIRVWNLDGTLRCALEGHDRIPIVPVAFSPTEPSILTASLGNAARLWSLDGETLVDYAGHEDMVTCLDVAPDGASILTGSSDMTARLWSRDGRCLAVLEGHEFSLTAVLFLPNGEGIATTDAHDVRVWGTEGGQTALLDAGPGRSIQSLAYSPDGRRLAAAFTDGTTSIWTLEDGERVVCEGHSDSALTAVFSPDGTKLLTSSLDRTARLYSIAGDLLTEFKGHTGALQVAAFSPDGRRVVTAGAHKTACLWNLGGGLEADLVGHGALVYDARFSPDGSSVVTAGAEGTARVWSAEAEEVDCARHHTREATCAVVSPDGRILATGSLDKGVKVSRDGGEPAWFRGSFGGAMVEMRLLDPGLRILATDQCGFSWLIDPAKEQIELLGLECSVHPSGQILLVAKSPSTRLLTSDGEVLCEIPETGWSQGFSPGRERWFLWSAISGIAFYDFEGERVSAFSCPRPVAFGFDGARFVTAKRGEVYEIWTIAGERVTPMETIRDKEDRIAASSQSGLFAVLPKEGDARVFDFDGRAVASFDPGNERSALLFHPTESLILTAGGGWTGGTARLWNTDGEVVGVFRGPSESIVQARISEDGTHLLARTWAGEAWLWTMDGTCTAVMDAADSPIARAEFSEDGGFVITMHEDGSVRTWNVSTEAVIRLARERMTRGWFPAEARRYESLLGEIRKLEADPAERLRTWYPGGNVPLLKH